MAKKLMMMVEYPPSEASAGGGSMRGAVVAAVFGVWADTWTDPDTGYTWTYSINGEAAEIMV